MGGHGRGRDEPGGFGARASGDSWQVLVVILPSKGHERRDGRGGGHYDKYWRNGRSLVEMMQKIVEKDGVVESFLFFGRSSGFFPNVKDGSCAMDDCWQYQSFFALGLGFSVLHHSASESMLTSPNTFEVGPSQAWKQVSFEDDEVILQTSGGYGVRVDKLFCESGRIEFLILYEVGSVRRSEVLNNIVWPDRKTLVKWSQGYHLNCIDFGFAHSEWSSSVFNWEYAAKRALRRSTRERYFWPKTCILHSSGRLVRSIRKPQILGQKEGREHMRPPRPKKSPVFLADKRDVTQAVASSMSDSLHTFGDILNTNEVVIFCQHAGSNLGRLKHLVVGVNFAITHSPPTLPLRFLPFAPPFLPFLLMQTTSFFLILVIYEVIHIFFVLLTTSCSFIVPYTLDVLNLGTSSEDSTTCFRLKEEEVGGDLPSRLRHRRVRRFLRRYRYSPLEVRNHPLLELLLPLLLGLNVEKFIDRWPQKWALPMLGSKNNLSTTKQFSWCLKIWGVRFGLSDEVKLLITSCGWIAKPWSSGVKGRCSTEGFHLRYHLNCIDFGFERPLRMVIFCVQSGVCHEEGITTLYKRTVFLAQNMYPPQFWETDNVDSRNLGVFNEEKMEITRDRQNQCGAILTVGLISGDEVHGLSVG
ncbi:hypothetical protein EDD15DRAFT_2190712 [Pisolithus albus]|nr:hypothetical protein EDD15DRAFT_2190712 [Pisolithus albus]